MGKDLGSRPVSGGICWDWCHLGALKAADNGKAGILEFRHSVFVVPALPELPELWPFLQMPVLATSPLLLSVPRNGVCMPGTCPGQAGTDLDCKVSTEFQNQPWSRAAGGWVSRNQRRRRTLEGPLLPAWWRENAV